MAKRKTARLAWEDDFIAALAELKIVSRAARAVGLKQNSPYARKKRSADFSRRWDEALKDRPAKPTHAITACPEKPPAPNQWKRAFLEMLAETSNVTASARHAKISSREVYKFRRENTEFAALWQAALFEGYAHLEMEVLGYLRDPKPEQKMDVANALRLLAAHKDSIAQETAVRKNVSVAEIRASIERKVEALRERVALEKAHGAQ